MTNDKRAEDAGFKRGAKPLCLGGLEGAEPPSIRADAGATARTVKPPDAQPLAAESPNRYDEGGRKDEVFRNPLHKTSPVLWG